MDCIITAFKLLRGSQLAHAQAVIECVVSNPWMVNMEELRSDLKTFAQDLRVLNEMPGETRWYVKLLTTDNNAIFNRQGIKRLSAVSVAWKKTVDPSFVGYKGDDTAYAGLVMTFKAHVLAQKMQSITGDNLAAELGLPSVPLPPPIQQLQVNPVAV
jgi:hypothetical protein